MNEPRKILEFSVSENKLPKFLEENRGIMVSEIVAAAEELLYTNTDSITVCKISIKKSAGRIILECKITLDDILMDLNELLNWTVEREEYELSHRLKLLDDYIKSNGIKPSNSDTRIKNNLYKIVE
jgi:hypothetical protein